MCGSEVSGGGGGGGRQYSIMLAEGRYHQQFVRGSFLLAVHRGRRLSFTSLIQRVIISVYTRVVLVTAVHLSRLLSV